MIFFERPILIIFLIRLASVDIVIEISVHVADFHRVVFEISVDVSTLVVRWRLA